MCCGGELTINYFFVINQDDSWLSEWLEKFIKDNTEIIIVPDALINL